MSDAGELEEDVAADAELVVDPTAELVAVVVARLLEDPLSPSTSTRPPHPSVRTAAAIQLATHAKGADGLNTHGLGFQGAQAADFQGPRAAAG